MSEGKIEQSELSSLFGSDMPMEAVTLLWTADGAMTIGEIRQKLRAMAPQWQLKKRVQEVLLFELTPRLNIFEIEALADKVVAAIPSDKPPSEPA